MKEKKKISQMVTMLLACVLLTSNVAFAAESDVKMSNVEYDVYYSGSSDNFLCNKKTIGTKPGTEYYLTYTVDCYQSGGKQAGVVGTSDPKLAYPYDKGAGMLFYKQHAEEDNQNELLKEGYTYFIKFTALKSGFRYVAFRAKGDTSEYFVLDTQISSGESDIKCGYFGIWLAGGWTNAHLSHVRFYDKDGNDLGVQSPRTEAAVVKAGRKDKAKEVPNWYTIKATNLENLAISNKLPLTTSKMYIEYTVKSTTSTSNQTGIAYSNQPEANYPHSKGLLRYEGTGKNDTGDFLLQEGTSYFITLERSEYGFTALVQLTKNGKTRVTGLPILVGTLEPNAQYFSLWFGEGAKGVLNFVLENVKIYDENYKNLEVQSNKEALSIRRHGALTDYSGCEAVYYCKENNGLYALFANQTFVHTIDSTNTEGKYAINNNKITFDSEDNQVVSDYLYKYITMEDGKVYNRLYTYQVEFVADGDNDITTQTLTAQTGYYAVKPEAPKWKDYTFDSWCTIDGTEFDFNKVVTESTTLYAKWKDADGVTYMSQGNTVKWYGSPVIAIGASVVLLAAATGVSVWIVKAGGKKNGRKENN